MNISNPLHLKCISGFLALYDLASTFLTLPLVKPPTLKPQVFNQRISFYFFYVPRHPFFGFKCKCYFLFNLTYLLSHVWLVATPWTTARQAPLSMELSRQEYWSGWPCPSPGDLPDPGIEPTSPALADRSFITEPPGKTMCQELCHMFYSSFINESLQPQRYYYSCFTDEESESKQLAQDHTF